MGSNTVTISKEEFDSFISKFAHEHDLTVRYVDDAGGKQIVYEFDLPSDPDEISIRIFSSINDEEEYEGKSYAGQSRAKGYGSIKSVLWHKEFDKPITGRSHTKRIDTWKSNLTPKLEDLLEDKSYYCDECDDGILIIRSSQHGQFKGCTNYPACENKGNL